MIPTCLNIDPMLVFFSKKKFEKNLHFHVYMNKNDGTTLIINIKRFSAIFTTLFYPAPFVTICEKIIANSPFIMPTKQMLQSQRQGYDFAAFTVNFE